MSKAFDAVITDSILRLISDFGNGGPLYNWLQTYLVGRVQYVKIKGHVSASFTANSGLPQRSHSGPLLFVLVMNKLPDKLINALILIYSEDVKIFLPVKANYDCLKLQLDMQSFGQFCSDSGLNVNAEKCSVMTFSRKIAVIEF